jgi:hypothetical protein
MTSPNESAAGGGKNGSGAVVDDIENEEVRDPQKLLEAHERLLAQRKKDQVVLKAQQDRLADLERKDKDRQDAEALKRGEHEKVISARDKRILELESEKTKLRTDIENGIRLQSFLDALPGKLKHPDYLGFVRVDQIPLREDGSVDDQALKLAVSDFVKTHSALIETKPGAATLPGGAARPNSKLSRPEWEKLSLKDKRARWNDVDWVN